LGVRVCFIGHIFINSLDVYNIIILALPWAYSRDRGYGGCINQDLFFIFIILVQAVHLSAIFLRKSPLPMKVTVSATEISTWLYCHSN